jgi:Prophage tail length tape measure protein
MPDLSLVFDLLARDRASSEVAKVGDSMKKAGDEGSRMGGLIKTGIGMAAGALVGAGLVSTLTDFYDAAAESAKIGKLTENVIRSTGAAAGITADQVGDLATALSNKTGQDDEAIQSAENLLLTFTNVRNEAGKGNDVFNQTAALALDMSTALGTDASSAAMQLGKALNDPVRGVTALTKSGVSFTQQQKDQIKAMVAAGDTLGAQRIILGEVSKEFGGAAEAAATPMDRMKVAAGNLQETIGAALIPAFSAAAGGVSDFLSGFMDGTDELGSAQNMWAVAGAVVADTWNNKIYPALKLVGDYGRQVFDILFRGDFTGGPLSEDSPVVDTLFRLRDGFIQVAGFVTGQVVPAFAGLVPVVGAVASAVLSTVVFFAEHQAAAVTLGIVVGGVLAVMTAAWIAQAAVAVSSAGSAVAAWFTEATAATTSATIQSRSTAQIVVGWLAAAGSATWNAAKVAASWVAMAAGAVAQGAVVAAVWTAQVVASAVTGAAGFAVQVASVVAGWVAMAAGAVANGIAVAAVWTGQMIASAVSGAVAFGVQAAAVVGGWVLMGVQAMIQAAQMAAAWFIALGPIGWAIAAVVGIVALIIANWDTVKNWTISAWNAVSGAVGAAWDWIKGAVGAALNWLVNLFLNFTGPGLIIKHWDDIKRFTAQAWDAVVGFVTGAWGRLTGAISAGVGQAVSFMSGLPGRLLSAVGNLGSLLVSAGSDLLSGLWSGIQSMTNWLRGRIGSLFGSLLPGWARDLLGIHSPSTVFAQIGRDTMAGYAVGIADATPAVVDEVGQAAQAILDRMTSGQALFEDWSWLGNPDVVRRNNDQLLAEFQRSGAAAGDFLRGVVASHTTPAALNVGNMVKWGDVSEEVWKQLLAQGWKGRAGDRIEAIYRPAEQPAYTPPAPVYEMPVAPPQAEPPVTYQTTVSGVASPEQVAAEVLRAQRTSEFLAGAW